MRPAGVCDARFAGLRAAFEENFATRGELGASVAVELDGRLVVDLSGGFADAARTRVWHGDTLVDVFSVGKPMAAICLLRLAERGRLDLDAPVARYWPEFAAAGKSAVTVRMLLGHRAGLPAIRRDLPARAMYDWGLMADALAEQEPWWEPGSAHGYHVCTFGFLVGEIVRRVSGTRIGAFLGAEVAGPLGADFRFGLAATDRARAAEFTFGRETTDDPADRPAAGSVDALMVERAYWNPPGVNGVGTVDTDAWRDAQMPSTNGYATARGVARIYAALACGGAANGVRLLERETLEQAIAEASAGPDLVLGRPSRFGLGFQLTQPERPLGPSPRSFGHFGAGGSLGFADPDAGLAFAYTMNLGGPRWRNPRNRALIDALYDSLQ